MSKGASRKRLPFLKFFTADWRSDPKVRMVSLAARGLWIDMLCLMHEAEPRGSLLIGERPVTTAQLASLVGAPKKEVENALNELRDADVFSTDGNDTIYSRRMRRDDAKAEQDWINGSQGGNPALKRRDNTGVNPPDILSNKLDTRSQNPESLEKSIHGREGSQGDAKASLGRPASQQPIRRYIEPDATPTKPDEKYAIEELGMTPEQLDRQWRMFVNWNTGKGAASSDWSANWRSWCDRLPEIQDNVVRMRARAAS